MDIAGLGVTAQASYAFLCKLHFTPDVQIYDMTYFPERKWFAKSLLTIEWACIFYLDGKVPHKTSL